MNKFKYNYRYTFYDKDANELYEFIERKVNLEEVNEYTIKQLVEIAKNNKNVVKIIFSIERYDNSLISLLNYVIVEDDIKRFLDNNDEIQREINEMIKEFKEEREIFVSDIDETKNKIKVLIQNMMDMLDDGEDEFEDYICSELDITQDVYDKIRDI